MPIITTQRRMSEQGRIRLGQKVATSSGKSRPDKLDRFRFTSPNRALIDQIAAKYGGTAREWDNAGKAEHEVISDAKAIPVIVVKGGFSQWHEAWSKGGLQHRCDGEKDPAGAYCDPDDPAHREAIAKPTTRLSVMLAEIESLGVWRLETKGWNAAAELPTMAELAQHVGDLVPATLSLAERSSIVETARGPQTSRFVVPVLDLQVTKARLVEIAGASGGMAAIEGATDALQIEAAQEERPDYAALLEQASTVEEAQQVWHLAGQHGDLDDALKALIAARGKELAGAPAAEPQPATEEVVAEVVDDTDADQAAWMACLTYAGTQGWTTDQLRDLFEQTYAIPLGDGDAARFADFLAQMKAGKASAA